MAFSIEVKIDDTNLRSMALETHAKIRQVVTIAAHNVERRAKEKVPVDTGATKNSIQPEFDPSGTAARIGPSTEYAPHLEFGTHRMRARPFLIPALEAERVPFIAAVRSIIRG